MINNKLFKYFVILADSALALWMYVNPSLKYAGDSLFNQIFLTFCSLAANFFVILWTANMAFEYAKNRNIQHKNFNGITAYPHSTSYKISKYSWIALGAVSSIGAAAIAIQEGGGTITYRTIEAIGVLAANLPLNMYGALELFKEHGEDITRIFKKIIAPKKILKSLLIKNNLITIIRSACQKVITDETKLDFKVDSKNPNTWHTIFEYGLQKTEMDSRIRGNDNIVSTAKAGIHISEQANHTPSPFKLIYIKKKKDSFCIIFGLLGSIICSVSAFGYVLSTKKLTDLLIYNSMLSISFTIFISLISSYLNVLFGYKTFIGLWNIVVSLYQKRFEKPLAFLLYPKFTLLLMICALAISFFSYAVFTQLIVDNFPHASASILVQIAKVSVAIFNGYCSVQLVKDVIAYYALHFGNEKKQKQVRLSNDIKTLITTIKEMEAKSFMHFLNYNIPKPLIALISNEDEGVNHA